MLRSNLLPRVILFGAASFWGGACGGAQNQGQAQAVTQSPVAAAPAAESPAADDTQAQSDDQGVALSGETGTLDETEVNNVFQEHWSAISRCYTQAIGGRYYLAGTMTVKVKVGRDGMVAKATVQESDLGCYQAERCILGVVNGLHFPRPVGGPTAELTYPVQFPERATILSWDVAHVEKAVKKQKASLATCPGTPPPGLTATLYVGPGGVVQSSGLSADGPIADDYGQCVIGQLAGWLLPDPRGGVAKVQLPLE